MKSAKPPVVACPTCGATVPWTAESRWKPFCSERCKMIDLGQWATEKYRVPAEEQEPDDGSPPPQ
ncbi:MAG: DNA gyrase inhibitor YacG [Thiobacillus sp.]